MIPSDFIVEWRGRARWATDEQVEQDLVLSRALVAIFPPGASIDGATGRARVASEILPLLRGNPWKGAALRRGRG